MPEEKHEDFEIPSFIESKDEIDKSLFKLDENIDLGSSKNEYIPAHSGNTAFKKQIAEELNEALAEEDIHEKDSKNEKIPLWIILVGTILLVITIIFASLILKDLFVTSDNEKPQPTVAPTPTPLATTSPSITSLPTTSPSAEVTPSPSPNTNIQDNEYILNASMNVRSGAGTNFSLIETSDMPSAYRNSSNGSVIKEGTVVKVLETRSVSGSKWGRIGEKAWICLADDSQIYAKKK